MAKNRAAQVKGGSNTKELRGVRKPAQRQAAPSTAGEPRSAGYDDCMKAYRSASKRYRKTLDALGK
jgi:hypothetical protein